MINIKEIVDDNLTDYKKCPTCGKTKRRLYEYKDQELCEDCLIVKILYDEIVKFEEEKDLDTFARLHSFYSYKGGAAHFRTFFQLIMVDLWSIKQPNIERIREIWDKRYKKYSLNEMIRSFIEMEILSPAKMDEENNEYFEWGKKINYLIAKYENAQTNNDTANWFYDISNIIKTAEAMIGMYDEIERKTIDRNRWAIMKTFTKNCFDNQGNIKEDFKIYDVLEKGGYVCKFKMDNGTYCNIKKDFPEDLYIHLGEIHNVPKEEKEEFIEKREIFIGVKVPSNSINEKFEKVSYTSYPKLLSRLVTDKSFFSEIGKRGWIVHPNVALTMEKALIKTKEYIKEKVKEKEKEQ